MYIPYTAYNPKPELPQQPKSSKKIRLSKHAHTERCMSQCPGPDAEMRNHRCSSRLLGSGDAQAKKPSLLSRLFRSKSDDTMTAGSPPISPKPSPATAPRRRFVRVVRDEQSAGEEYVNPHVIRKHSHGYWERQRKNMEKSQSLDEGRSSSGSPPKDRHPLPYTVTGPTILKKYHSLEDTSTSPSSSSKHILFKEEVEVVEFDIQSKCEGVFLEAEVCHERLQDGLDSGVNYGLCVRAEWCGVLVPGCQELLASVDNELEETMSALEMISETDELKSPSEECLDLTSSSSLGETDSHFKVAFRYGSGDLHLVGPPPAKSERSQVRDSVGQFDQSLDGSDSDASDDVSSSLKNLDSNLPLRTSTISPTAELRAS